MSAQVASSPGAAEGVSHEGYYKRVHTIGRITSVLMILANVLPVILVGVIYGIWPDLAKVMPALGIVWGILLPFFLTEGWMYFPVVGVAGNYMAVAGNIGNMRIPAASVAQDVMGTEPGSIEAEIVGNIAISTSIFFSIAFILAGALLGNVMVQNLPAWMQSAFGYAIPCIFGALIAQFSLKGPKYALIIVPIAYLVVYFAPFIVGKNVQTWHRVLPMLVVLLPLAWFAYKKLGIYWVAGGKKG